MARVLVGHEQVQVRDGDELLTGYLEVDEDGIVRFAQTPAESPGQSPSEAVKGSLGEFEEVEEPVSTEE